MTAATFTHLPLQVGGVALASAGRAALWVIQRFMRAPLTNSAIMALVVTSAMAGSNALYGQRHAHPAPLFAPFAVTPAANEVQPVIPATKPKKLGAKKALVVGKPVPAKTVLQSAEANPIGNADVLEVQRKLEMLQLFTGKIDGFYGPQTARAIKKFEELSGMKPKGELTVEMVELIRKAPLSLSEPQDQPAAVTPLAKPMLEESQPEAIVLPKKLSAPVEEELPAALPAANAVRVDPESLAALKPLDQPKPLTMELETGSIARAEEPAEATVLGRPVPKTPEAALEMAAETAGDAIDTIISGVETVAMTKPGKRAAAVQQFVADVTTMPIAQPATTEVAELTTLPDKPKVGVALDLEETPAKPGEDIAVLDTPATPDEIMRPMVSDPVFVAKVQRGLASLGFLHGPADGVAGEATAKAIRNFETYFNYDTTGRISPELLDLLIENGAAI